MAMESSEHGAMEATSLSRMQTEALLRHVQERADQARRQGTIRSVVDEIIVLILVHAGLRAEELCALRIADTPAITVDLSCMFVTPAANPPG